MHYIAADIDELTAWMKATGAEQILGMSAMEVMARYDSDGSGQLDQEEMDDIKAWVQREREKAEAAAATRTTSTPECGPSRCPCECPSQELRERRTGYEHTNPEQPLALTSGCSHGGTCTHRSG